MCVKYRRKVLIGGFDRSLKDLVLRSAEEFKVSILEQETDKDHIHIVFSCKPSLAPSPSRFVNSLKSITSRWLRKEFPGVMKKYLWDGQFWSASYFLASTGQVTLEDIKHYVQTQKEK